MKKTNIYEVMEIAIKEKASDIHLVNDLPPTIRKDGLLIQLREFEINTPEWLEEQTNLICNEKQRNTLNEKRQVDFSIEHNGFRFRVHIYYQRYVPSLILRLINSKIPKFEDLNLPLGINRFLEMHDGLILVTGVTGSGKSTTLASMIDHINRTQNKNIITIEDPIEYVHTHKCCVVNQREVGQDVPSFAEAIKSAMRADPDILLVGEMRDLETIQNAITMAETGHLVLGTLHTKSCPETIDRIIDVFPEMQQQQIRIQLANTLKGVINQRLVPKVGGGRVPIVEIMYVTDAIRALIKEGGNINAIKDEMLMNSKKVGSQTVYQSVADLLKRGLITKETAVKNVDDLMLLKKFL